MDIADAFLRSEEPQWDSTVDDAALDDYGLPADDQPLPDYQPPRRQEGERPDYSSWVGDYGPVNAKGEKPMPPADGEEAARDLAASSNAVVTAAALQSSLNDRDAMVFRAAAWRPAATCVIKCEWRITYLDDMCVKGTTRRRRIGIYLIISMNQISVRL